MRVLVAGISTETNTFASTPTTLDDFKWRQGTLSSDEYQDGFPHGKSILNRFRGTRSVVGGFITVAEKDGIELDFLMGNHATPGGIVQQDAYDVLKEILLKRIDGANGYQGILLNLHGAMVTESIQDVEGDLLAAVREKVGPAIPIIATLDLHANSTKKMAENANVLIGYDLYPHTDLFERGVEAAETMKRIIQGKIVPTLAWYQLPLITMPPKQCTLIEPMKSLLKKAHTMEEEDKVINVTLSMGFPFSDIYDAGVSVLVTTNNDQLLAETLAKEMAQKIWDTREEFSVSFTPIAEAIEYAATQAKGVVILSDGSDNPGGGAPCDGTTILQEFINHNVQNAVIAIIVDPESVAKAVEAGVGNNVTLHLGGKTDNKHGAPVHLTAYVKLLSDGTFIPEGPMNKGVLHNMGRTAVLVKDGIEIVVTERRLQPYDTALLQSVGIEPTKKRIIALKSAVHYRSTYQAIADRIFEADTPGVHRFDFNALTYNNLRTPLYPLQKQGTHDTFQW
ncbi:MAG: M81 family metallopeptidase [Candidatus Ratteibacteria bacterium]|jgi:microcystin degradation protein MlrC